jgi:cytochrome c oxidase subunit II
MGVALVLPLAGCVDIQSALHPRGPGAATIATMWWVMLAVGSAVIVLVTVLAVLAVRRRGRPAPPGGDSLEDAERLARRWLVRGGIVLPAVVSAALFVWTVTTLRALSVDRVTPAVDIEVTGRQWWWDVRYLSPEPSQIVRTANELHIPVGARVRVRLRSDDVIHSFWVPSLHGKIDMVPGGENETWIQADRAGVYRGQCAEFCGMQHAKMAFMVVAHEPADYDAWLARERAAARPPADSLAMAGLALLETRGCVACHAVRGTMARATVGPDLTHIGRRLTIGAGTLPNTRGNLAGWIADPQQHKPGNHMPRVPLTGDELLALVHYLEGLR